MIVKIIKTGETKNVSASYGLRLIEQGVAVAVPREDKAAFKPAEAPAPRKGKAGDA